MSNPLRLFVSLLVACLPACIGTTTHVGPLPASITSKMWQGTLSKAVVDCDTWTAIAAGNQMSVDRTGRTIRTTIQLPEQAPLTCCLRPMAGYEANFDAALAAAQASSCNYTLKVKHLVPPGVATEAWPTLLTATAKDRTVLVPMHLLVEPHGDAAATTQVLQLGEIRWTDVRGTTNTTDAFAIGWRTAATPITVAGDTMVVAHVVAIYATAGPVLLLAAVFEGLLNAS